MSDEQGWFPDYLLLNGQIETGVALFADESGAIIRFSRAAEDLARANRLKNRAIFPGLVNVHSHTFQRTIRGRTEWRGKADRDTFWTWREKMYAAALRLTPEQIYQTARAAFLEMLLSGITTVGEFHYLHHEPNGGRYGDPNLIAKLVIQAAREVGLRIVLLRTAYERAGYRKPPNSGQARFITPDPHQFVSDTESLAAWVKTSFAGHEVAVGVAPHSVRAVTGEYLRVVTEFARSHGLQVHMHVSEQPEENAACIQEYGMTPVTWLQNIGLLDDRFTAVHAIHINEQEVGFLAASGSSVCACPTSERNLGDGAVRADWLLERGVGICLGSDSQIQIDLLEDTRLLEYHLRMQRLERAVLDPGRGDADLGKVLYDCASKAGACALGLPVGELVVGQSADFFTVDLDDLSMAGSSQSSLVSQTVFAMERTAIKDVYVGGQCRVVDGRHALQEPIVAEFRAVQRDLWD